MGGDVVIFLVCYGVLVFASLLIWIFFLWQLVVGFRKGYRLSVTGGFFVGFWALAALGNLCVRTTKSSLIALAFLVPLLLLPVWYRRIRDRGLTTRAEVR
jgi:hypothetical protein